MSVLISMQSVILTAAILLLIASWRLYEKRRSFRNITSKLPTQYGLPFIGVTYKFFNLSKVYSTVSRGFDEIKSLTGCVWVATTPIIITVEPEVIEHVTSSSEFLNKARDLYAHFNNGVINGIIVNPVKKWKPGRKAISPFLSHNNLMSFFPLFNDNAKNVKQKLIAMAGRGEQDVYGVIKAYGLQLSILTIMGTKIDEGSENYKEVMNAFNILVHRTAQNSVYSSVGLGFLTLTPEYKKTLKYLRELVCDLIKKNPSLKAESDEYEDGKQALVNLAVKAMKQGLFTASDVEIESFTMIAASYETSAIVVYSALVLLAMHPEIQERAFEEVRSVFPHGITSVEYDDLKKFPYLDMVIAEALRVAPPIPYIGRQAINETELRPGITIPKEMQVIIPIFELHRRKELWGPEAARFNPENFLPENIAKRHPCAYMAFSKGPRNCIGVRYAEFTVHVLLITLLRSLKFSTTFKYDDIVFMPNVTLSYKVEPLLSIEVRA
ncbi:PREDICTED: probable cytochrome P450 313a4 [Rhagoletis zephyria]|uniref:probable cytochrome P450 313a4 n=1 Tax=Rhagoletis zephyria TaxID=28612 RepID=UPI0008115E1A|nr:PREDICTED: probable cytochrome P450 313a4 [Rhagoletis zephyria]